MYYTMVLISILKDFVLYKLLFWVTVVAIILIDAYIYKELNFKISEMMNILIASVAGITALVAFYQLKANHEWNRRHSAMIEAEKSRDKYSRAIKSLNKTLNYREQEESYSLTDIHGFICNGNDHTKNPDITDDGKKIKHNIYVILNYYEYLSIGIKNGVFDERIIRELVRGGLIKAHKLFGEYAQHIRDKHTKNKNQFIEIKKLAEKWSKEVWYKRLLILIALRGKSD